MSPRRDYLDDPNAPKANRVVPAASAIVLDDAGRILLHKRTDNGLWSIPGGEMEPGESIAETAIREIREETGIEARVDRLLGVYSNPRPRHRLRRWRGATAVLGVLPLPRHGRPAHDLQRDIRSPVRRPRGDPDAEHAPIDSTTHIRLLREPR